MRLFAPLYDRILRWAGHTQAPWYLGALSFAESSFFPVPPDVMLAPMVMARRERAWRYALLATAASTVGGMFGYLIGYFAFEAVEPLVRARGYWDGYLQVREWFAIYGAWVVLLAGFSPIPYKVFTITAGAVAMAFLPFVLASIVGRGARFFLVAGLLRWGGKRIEPLLTRYVEALGWLAIGVAVVAYLLTR